MMPILVMTGSASTSATSPAARLVSSAGMSLNSITLVVSTGLTGGPKIAVPRTGHAILIQGDESLIHRAVVTIVENQDFWSAR